MEETICLQCGDRGFTNAFVYCVKCLNFAVHRYCLDVIPETLDEFVYWLCDDCEVEVQSRFAVHKHDPIPSQTRVRIVSENIEGFCRNGTKINDLVVVQKNEHVNDDSSERSNDSRTKLDLVECGVSANQCTPMQLEGKNDEREVDERKVSQQSSSFQQVVEENVKGNLMQHVKVPVGSSWKEKKKKYPLMVKKRRQRNIMESTTKKDHHRLGNTSSEQPYEECMEVDINKCTKNVSDSTLPSEVKENKGSEQRDQMCSPTKPFNADTDPNTAEHPIIACNGPSRSSKKKAILLSIPVLDDQMHEAGVAQPPQENNGVNLENQSADITTEERKLGSSNHHTENKELEDKKEKTCTTIHRSNICRDYPKDLNISAAEPVVMPIWRGSFNILNKKCNKLNEVIAHISSKACQKVYEAASQFQPVLQLEMLPRTDIWPKSFETSEPSGDSIALYFFPSKMIEQVFNRLVEKMMRKELGFKAVVQNAELLIFTSTELPLRYWTFRSKYYLWGVFRGKQRPPSHSRSSIEQVAKIPLTKKRCGDQSPLSPLSNSASYGSGTF